MTPQAIESFWRKVRKTESCWLWTGAKRNGYGNFRSEYAHRVSFKIDGGEIPDGYVVHHRCHNKRCVNPAHLVAIGSAVHSRLHGDRFMREPRLRHVEQSAASAL